MDGSLCWGKPSLSFLLAPSLNAPVAASNPHSKCLIMGINQMNLSLVQVHSELFQNVVKKALTHRLWLEVFLA